MPCLFILRLQKSADCNDVADVGPRHAPTQHAIDAVVIPDRGGEDAAELLGHRHCAAIFVAEQRRIELIERSAERNALRSLKLYGEFMMPPDLAKCRPAAGA